MAKPDAIIGRDGEPVWWGPVVAEGAGEDAASLVAEALGVSGEEAEGVLEAEGSRRRYLLHETLSASPIAEVYRAVDRHLARPVVVKIHRNGHALREARAVSLARHANVVQLHEHGSHDGREYMVFEYCEGTTLERWTRGRAWPEIVARILEAGRGLEHCHKSGLVHGDVKPGNILITQGRAVLADFGLAGDPQLTDSFGGTVGYIAPEVSAGVRGPKADVFSLAVTAWFCLLGRLPYAGKTIDAQLVAAHDWPPAMPGDEEWPEGAPLELFETIARGMHPEMPRRPKLALWLAELEEHAGLPEERARLSKMVRRFAASALVFLLIGAGGHATVVACTSEEPRVPVPEPELAELEPPSMERAIELANEEDPLGAWAVFWATRESRPVLPAECLELAEILVEFAKEQDEPTRGTAADAGRRVANHGLGQTVSRSVDPAVTAELWRVRGEADTLLSRYK